MSENITTIAERGGNTAMARRCIVATAEQPSERLTCVVEATLAENVRDMAWRQRRSVSMLVAELVREALAHRAEQSGEFSAPGHITTNATA